MDLMDTLCNKANKINTRISNIRSKIFQFQKSCNSLTILVRCDCKCCERCVVLIKVELQDLNTKNCK